MEFVHNNDEEDLLQPSTQINNPIQSLYPTITPDNITVASNNEHTATNLSIPPSQPAPTTPRKAASAAAKVKKLHWNVTFLTPLLPSTSNTKTMLISTTMREQESLLTGWTKTKKLNAKKSYSPKGAVSLNKKNAPLHLTRTLLRRLCLVLISQLPITQAP